MMFQKCMAAVIFLIVVFTIGKSTSVDTQNYCLANENNPYPYYATRSAYSSVRSKVEYQPIPGCTPVKLWMVVRHASRYPSKSKIHTMKPMMIDVRDQIINNYENISAGSMCQKDIENLKKWTYNFTDELGDKVTQEGLDDLRTLAYRLKLRFPRLLNTSYTPQLFQFKTSAEAQSMESATAFVKDLFNLSDTTKKIPDVAQNEKLLHPQMVCPKWVEVVDSPEMNREESLFIAGDIVSNMIATISERLGFTYNLTYDIVKNMYGMCRYENVCYDQLKSPFCAAFTPDDLKIMEYAEDVHRYYQDGYGNDVDAKLACPMVKDLISKFSEADSTDSSPVSIFFGHSGTVMELVTALGIKKDKEPLKHDLYLNMTNRLWKTSFIAPFNANFLAVLYKCKQGELKVQFFLNEWLVLYPGCDNITGLCPFHYIQKKYDRFLNDDTCNLGFCFQNSNPIWEISIVKWTVIAVLSLIFLYLLLFRIYKMESVSLMFRKSEYSSI